MVFGEKVCRGRKARLIGASLGVFVLWRLLLAYGCWQNVFLEHDRCMCIRMAQDVWTKPSQQTSEVIVQQMISGQETKGKAVPLDRHLCENICTAPLSIVYGFQ